ncbi:hypothetical protein [Leptospira stimsonii]|uniref:DUF3592 domain-containing protein n=1 Tax=Leptospira stimsonii TaxID=2202203 RepID=A0ABY2N485_9LEPT|nr:hypothetical protein [Leptospira stimsonii]TGK22915.1 hypothetical protein EHO98_06470 [Leptospira stimsonii]TGM16651.1 hypothetical protein EHQ90_09795 [Leptospira stimsonii]
MMNGDKKIRHLLLAVFFILLIFFTCKFDRWVGENKTVLPLPGLYCFYNFEKYTIRDNSTSAFCPEIKDFSFEEQYGMFSFTPAQSIWIIKPQPFALDKKKIISYGMSPLLVIIFFLLSYSQWIKFTGRK